MPPNNEWDLSKVIAEKDRFEIERHVNRNKNASKKMRCWFGMHRWSSWDLMGVFQMGSTNSLTGAEVSQIYKMGVRVCYECGRPQINLKESN